MIRSTVLEDVPTAYAHAAHRLRAFIARRAPAADVDDILQDTWLRVHRGLSALREGDRFGAWLYQVARSAIIEHQRGKIRAALEPHGTECGSVAGAERDAERLATECARSVGHLVPRLPSPYREAITMTELDGLSQTAVAHQLGLSISGMKSRVQRGRARLRQLFEECCVVELDARGRIVACERRCGDHVPDAAEGQTKGR